MVDEPRAEDNVGQGLADNQNDADIPNVRNEEITLMNHGEEPQSYAEAIASPDRAEWEAAMEEELNSIARLGTFELVHFKLPSRRKAIGTVWVFLVKRHNASQIVCFMIIMMTHKRGAI